MANKFQTKGDETKNLTITSNRDPPQLSMLCIDGLTINNMLTWNNHIEDILLKNCIFS